MTNSTRRGFLAGLGTLICAPAVVHAQNLMPVSEIDPFYTRYLAAYNIMTDSFILRVDRARFPLFQPNEKLHKCGVVLKIPPHIAHRYIPVKLIKSLKPAPGIQQQIDTIISWNEMKMLGLIT